MTSRSDPSPLARWAFVDDTNEHIEQVLATAEDVTAWEAAHAEYRARNGINWPGPMRAKR